MKQVRILAMYDVRGIQDYIFRTAKVKDAIGASGIVEDIIYKALKYALKCCEENGRFLTSDLEWYDKNGVRPYSTDKEKDVQVLYIGGGNAFFTFCDEAVCKVINRYMSKYIIDETYSLQLAIAMTECTGDYKNDYEHIFQKMNQVKEHMIVSRPVGALPIMKRDTKTGYTIPYEADSSDVSDVEESLRKKAKERVIRKNIEIEEKIFDNYVTEKGLDSTLGIVHIDGNNMGLRIRRQIENITDYNEAVLIMRRISYRINHAYKKVFEQMREHYDRKGKEENGRENSVLKILVAGDDVTYVCNGGIALDTVEFFTKEIVCYTMDGRKQDTATGVPDRESNLLTENQESFFYEYPLEKETDVEKLRGLGFSVCAGIAYINSHFPFYAGYEVAEACCESAKSRAKMDCYMGCSAERQSAGMDRVANWVDFQICKNIQAQNLKEMRKKEYETSYGEHLILRPYFIKTEDDPEMDELVEPELALDSLKTAMLFFQDNRKIPKSFAKKLRNTYPQGEPQMNLLYNFLESRGWRLPDVSCVSGHRVQNDGMHSSDELYFIYKGKKTARWYDALEMFEYNPISKEAEAGEGNE